MLTARTGINSGTLRSAVEYGLALPFLVYRPMRAVVSYGRVVVVIRWQCNWRTRLLAHDVRCVHECRRRSQCMPHILAVAHDRASGSGANQQILM